MHTLLIILGGIATLGAFLLFGRLWGGGDPALAVAAKAFIPVWLVLSIVNLWIGVNRAGYTVGEEFPILLLVFAAPVLLAALAIWHYES